MAKKTSFEIKNYYYLCGPLALVAFFLMDVTGGFHFPGYDWAGQVTGDLVACNAYSLVLAMVFAVIYAVLTIFSAYCVYKFLKNLKFNKQIIKGIKLFLVAAIVAALGFCVFLQTEYGTYDKVKEYAQIATTEEVVESDSEDPAALSETRTVFDEEATQQNIENLGTVLAENPTVILGLLASIIANVLAIIALLFVMVGGFKKGGKTLFAAVAVFCLVLIVYSLIAVSVMAPDMLGTNSRFSTYSILLFLAFVSSYIYITNIEE